MKHYLPCQHCGGTGEHVKAETPKVQEPMMKATVGSTVLYIVELDGKFALWQRLELVRVFDTLSAAVDAYHETIERLKE
jgi:hypothetical protein